jgi:hypothetical protein
MAVYFLDNRKSVLRESTKRALSGWSVSPCSGDPRVGIEEFTHAGLFRGAVANSTRSLHEIRTTSLGRR